MRLVALIPARFGSTRFPGKPLADICGKPLIQRVYEQARQVRELDGLYVATDDQRIRECVEGFGGQVLMTRTDHPSGSDRLAEAARLLGLSYDDLVVNIQGDQPLFPLDLIAKLAAPLKRDPEAVMVTPARKITDPKMAANPNVVKVVFDRRHRALYFSRSPLPCWRDAGQPPYFYRHLGLYAYQVGFLQKFVHLPPGRWEEAEKLEQLRALEHGFPIHIVETTGDTLEVDTPADLRRAETYFAKISSG
ncbi:MAG: 3-deoxy-manno-octulosonate cytidylyltransferase [Deltaproteobacteria bacterium]|nr:3-deoxy-manno-octulosonate cytidylyltransferase [Deltaproteobacteria bacterium]